MSGIIPESFIQQLLIKIDIVEVVGLRLKLKKSGTNYSACCPFHHEKTPSFSVNQDKQFYYCFGCQKSGDAIQFLIDYEKISFVDAIETLASLSGLEVPKVDKVNNKFIENSSAANNSSYNNKQKIAKIYASLVAAKNFFANNLHKHNKAAHLAIEYLKGRKLDGATAKYFSLGYVADLWDSLIKNLNGRFDEQTLLDAGLTVKSKTGKTFDRFRSRIIFPIHDRRGRTIGFGGRIVNSGEPKYLNSPETIVFNKSKELYGLFENNQTIAASNNVLVVEGYMDVIMLWQAGIKNAVAALGTSITEQHLKLLFNVKDKITLCFDGDAAGRRALWRALELCLPLLDGKRVVNFLLLPDNLDPDQFVSIHGVNAFLELEKRAISIYDYIFKVQSEDLDLEHIEGKSSLVARIKPLINIIKIGYIQDLIYERLSAITGLDKSLLLQNDLHTYKANPSNIAKNTSDNKKFGFNYRGNNKFGDSNKFVAVSPKVNKINMQVYPAMRAAALLFAHRQLVKLLPEDLDELEKNNLIGMKLFLSLAKVLRESPDLDGSNIADKLARENIKNFEPQVLKSIAASFPADILEAEFTNNLAYMGRAKLAGDLDELLELARNGALPDEGRQRLQELLSASKEP